MVNESQISQRIVAAPLPTPASEKLPPNCVISVVLEDDEDVEWIWNTATNGVSYVSGYTIMKRQNENA